MKREDAVLLVSRALACIQAVTAVLEASYVPQRLVALYHYDLQLRSQYLTAYEQVQISFYFGRIAFLVFLTYLFWNCGPRIARFLLPEQMSAPIAAPREPDVDAAQ